MFIKKDKQKEAAKIQMESTQKFLAIDHIKDDTIILKDGSLKAVLLTSGINMELRNEMEQDSIISAYQGALTALGFPVQMLIQSRKVDLSAYLNSLENVLNAQTNALIREQTEEYIYFLEEVLDNVNVMDKKFFVIVSHYPNIIAKQSSGILSFLDGKKETSFTSSINYPLEIKELEKKVQIVTNLLKGIGLTATKIPTEALIELFYSCYNPDVSEHEHINNLAVLGSEYISARESVKEELEE